MTSSGSTVTHEGCFRGSRYCIGKQIKKGTTLNKEKIQRKPKNVPGPPLAFPRGARGDLRGGAPGQRREKARGKAGKIRTRAKRAATTLPCLGDRAGAKRRTRTHPFWSWKCLRPRRNCSRSAWYASGFLFSSEAMALAPGGPRGARGGGRRGGRASGGHAR